MNPALVGALAQLTATAVETLLEYLKQPPADEASAAAADAAAMAKIRCAYAMASLGLRIAPASRPTARRWRRRGARRPQEQLGHPFEIGLRHCYCGIP
jgi:hypothetical protein